MQLTCFRQFVQMLKKKNKNKKKQKYLLLKVLTDLVFLVAVECLNAFPL